MTKKRIAVIGAGPAGATAAYELSKYLDSGAISQLDLYEASNSPGGLARSIPLWGQQIDLGPHRFFSNDSRVNKLWLEVAGHDYEMVDRITRIYYKNSFFNYPLKPFNALSNLGVWEAGLCFGSYLKEKANPTKQDGTFETWVTGRFGKKLYEIFFKTYSEKLWGIKCDELDADFAAQRIKKLSLFEAIINAFKGGKNNKHKTLVDQFAYPADGTGMIYSRMMEKIIANGGKVHFNRPIKRVITEHGKVTSVETESGEVKEYDEVISSMPISLLVDRLPEVPSEIQKRAKSLKFRNTILVYLNVEAQNLFPDQWLYIHSEKLQTGRITNFSNWVPSINKDSKDTIICMEYWCNFEDEFWSWDESRLIELAKKELRATGLTGDAEISKGSIYKIPRCYPVYYSGYKETLKPVEHYLSSIEGLQVIGRYGSYKYNNQDHSILMGLLSSENVIEGKKNNLWEINTDYDSYQEESVITKTGLEKFN
ncbi:MAG: FAD-dependent oxidoreductase [Bacteroidota bacterium]